MEGRAEKEFKDFNIVLKIDDEHKGRFWMKVETSTSWKGKPYSSSWFVEPPNWIDRFRGITWQDKIAAMEKKLFTKIFKEMEMDKHPDLNKELDKWLKGATSV